ncbi:OLC1v1016261C1 [Oldenlandia corymbosa var. corymbosa]|uniref:OLC1v1016261C1 n=1 Tax=Oldenlandia corymbosa var. corymbosa TaxID=529605 RepID=A0AAV1E531_OLDCO|nr:OLC1v1016261C1 [Oldenlandia corymbosa var. corymbosa]
MFFFFVGGVNQQVKEVLKRGAGRCIACGSAADLVEYEKVLKIFFLPVKTWPGKQPVLHCDNCNLFFPQSFAPPPPPADERRLRSITDVLTCPHCSREVDPEFRFCPFCGSAL